MVLIAIMFAALAGSAILSVRTNEVAADNDADDRTARLI